MTKPFKFSTDTADYSFNFGWQDTTTKISNIEQFDTIVLETGIERYEDYTLKDLSVQKQYSNLIKENLKMDKAISLFFVDIPSKKLFKNNIVNHNFMKSYSVLFTYIPAVLSLPILPVGGIFALPFTSLCLSHLCGYNKTIDNFNSHLSLSLFYTMGGYRSAISAKKIDEFIAPEIQKRKDEDSKPNIFIEFGCGHNDICFYLKHKKIRDTVIDFNTKLKIHPVISSYLNKVCEMRPKFKECSSRAYISDKIISREYEPWSDEWENIVFGDKHLYDCDVDKKDERLNIFYNTERPNEPQTSNEWERVMYEI